MEINKNFLHTLIDIAKKAGDKILEVYGNEALFDRVDFKTDDSPLTLADQYAHLYIVEHLAKLTPDIPILSEEAADIPYETRNTWTRFWLVDPLDGTKEFIKRNGEFTVNIALVENGHSTLGVVYVPVQDLLYYGYKGGGAFVSTKGAEPIRIQSASFEMEDESLRIVCSRSHMSKPVEEYISKLNSPQTVSMGSSLKFMLLAEGKADIYPRLAPTMEWDTGAAQIIVEEAGGSVINNETGSKLIYNKPILRNPHFIAFGNKKS